MRVDHYLVIDLEATCCDQGTIRLGETETIEIGSVMADAGSLNPVDEFSIFVRPVRHPVLTEFCTKLTSITQADVDGTAGFRDALTQLIHWANSYPNYVFSSWGEYDRK